MKSDRDRIVQLERQLGELSRRVPDIPVRLGDAPQTPPLHVQLALVTEVTDNGSYPYYDDTFDLSFTIGNMPIVRAVLLDVGNTQDVDAAFLPVFNPEATTLEALKFYAYDVRRDGVPKVGDVVRVWTSDGEHVQPGEGQYNISEHTVSGDHFVYCDVLNPDDYLRALSTFVHGTPRLLSYDDTTDRLVWVDFGDAGAVPDWVFDYPTDPVAGAVLGESAEGYCITIIEVGGLQIINHDAITAAAGVVATGIDRDVFQFWIHPPGATVFGDAQWTTGTGYSTSRNQSLRHESGVWHCDTDPLIGTVATAIAKGTAAAPTSGTGTVYESLDAGATNSLGSKTIYNPFRFKVRRDCTLAHISGTDYLITSAPGYRSIRGQCTAAVATSDGTFNIDHVVALESGADPRDDATDVAETVSITNFPAESHADDEWIIADYDAAADEWQARPKGGGSGSGNGLWGKITTAASPGGSPPSTACVVEVFAEFGGFTASGVKNFTPDAAPVNKAARISGTTDDWTLDWWSCKEVT